MELMVTLISSFFSKHLQSASDQAAQTKYQYAVQQALRVLCKYAGADASAPSLPQQVATLLGEDVRATLH